MVQLCGNVLNILNILQTSERLSVILRNLIPKYMLPRDTLPREYTSGVSQLHAIYLERPERRWYWKNRLDGEVRGLPNAYPILDSLRNLLRSIRWRS